MRDVSALRHLILATPDVALPWRFVTLIARGGAESEPGLAGGCSPTRGRVGPLRLSATGLRLFFA